MPNTLSPEERERLLKIVSSFHLIFSEPDELRQALWSLIVAAAESEYFEDQGSSEKQKTFIAFDEILKYTEATHRLLYEDIKNYRKTITHPPRLNTNLKPTYPHVT